VAPPSTPIINTLSDAYGLIRFLQFRPWNDWSQFNEMIGRNEKRRPKLATDRLQSIFKTTLLRRNKDTVLDGKKLITLPPKSVELVKLEFCPEEREIYKAVGMALHLLLRS
jgi:SNF2 family DNA or RNA helicase